MNFDWKATFLNVFLDSGHAVFELSADNQILKWHGNGHVIMGDNSPLPYEAKAFLNLINPQDLPNRLSEIQSLLKAESKEESTNKKIFYRLRQADGSYSQIEETIYLIKEGNDSSLICVLKPYKPVRKPEAANSEAQENGALMQMSAHRSNVHAGRHLLSQAIERFCTEPSYQGDQSNAYLLAVGIDRFSLINETFGTAFADDILEEVGRRLSLLTGEMGYVQRIDGDVFGVFLHDAPYIEMSAVARTILAYFFDSPIQTRRGPVCVGVSIGGMSIERRSHLPASLITKAEMALRVAKERGRGCFVPYNEANRDNAGSRQILEAGDAFVKALRDDRVRLAYQPVVNSKTEVTTFHESLLRMVDETGKVVSAQHFIPAVEKLGLSRIVDNYTMQLALRELNAFDEVSLSVNVSNYTLSDYNWLRAVVSALRDRPDMAQRLVIEITETVAMLDPARTAKFIRTLRDLGCKVALDDFGAGYTAFSQLKELNLDMVKIDKSFVRNMKEGQNQLFIQTLQRLADGVQLETIGEGAETLSEVKLLADDGVNHIQGYAYGFPTIERVWLPKEHNLRKFSTGDFTYTERKKDSASQIASY